MPASPFSDDSSAAPAAKASSSPVVAENPEIVIEALSPFVTPKRKEKIEHALSYRTDRVSVVLDNLHDPHNAAAILRTCDAYGVSTVHILESRNPFHTTRKVTQGAHLWLSLHRYTTVETCIGSLRDQGFHLVALDHRGSDDLEHLEQLARTRSLALCFGNEHEGVSPELLRASDSMIRIPMHGFVTCLNVSVSAAVVLSRLLSRGQGTLSEEERMRLRARWYMRCVRGAEGIVSRYLETR